MSAGQSLGQSGSRRGQGGEEMGGEARGDGDAATSTEVSHLGVRGTLPHLLPIFSSWEREESLRLFPPPPHTAPYKRREAAESPYHCWPSFYVVCSEEEDEGHRSAGALTSGLAGLWAGRAEEEWLGLGESMRGPWTERRSWDCPACARFGQPCSRCSLAEPKETGCKCGGSGGARGMCQMRYPASGTLS